MTYLFYGQISFYDSQPEILKYKRVYFLPKKSFQKVDKYILYAYLLYFLKYILNFTAVQKPLEINLSYRVPTL